MNSLIRSALWPRLALVLLGAAGCAGNSRQASETGTAADAVALPAAETVATGTPAGTAAAGTAPATDKIRVTSLDELPQHAYALTGKASDLLDDDAAFRRLATAVRADLESDLAGYAIEDPATLRDMHGTLANLAMLEGRWQEAGQHLRQVAELQDKEASRLTSGLVGQALVEVHAQLGEGADPAAVKAEFRRQLQQRVAGLPWDVVQDIIEQRKGRAEYLSRNLLVGIAQTRFDPAAEQGEIGADIARSLVGMRATLGVILPLKEEMVAVYSDYIAANRTEKANIWTARDRALPPNAGFSPVMIGIWDSGVDVTVFADEIFVNPAERANGVDDDGNGFVDDVNGLAFDVDGFYSTDLLHPEGDQAGKVDTARQAMKGFIDLQASIDSPEAARARQTIANLPPEEVGDFMTALNFYGMYTHGTHVAGIALAGNPYAKILPARITFDYHAPPQAMTEAIARRHADSYRRTVAYFRQHGVRVVNMSWGWTFKEIEESLEANGVGGSPEERVAMARSMLDILADGLRDAMASAPEILFCVAAGNSDSDVEFDVSIPANFELDNMIVVGAVDQAGDPTSFTSGGENVVVYANGFEVDSDLPGGHHMAMSGTSMASPQVCNLAGKLFAINSDSTPPQVVRLVEETATPHADHPRMRLLYPSAAIERALKEAGRS